LPSDHYLYNSPFGRLGLPENSAPNLVKKHYKKLALIYHPDKYKGEKKGGELRFQRVKEAYEILSM
jgi:molecular chaperone DnaJ